MNTYNVIGIMSGTSLDGLDICFCNFQLTVKQQWRFKIIATSTIKYPIKLVNELANAKIISGLNLMLLHNKLGNFIGESIHNFMQSKKIEHSQINFISSHGHTIFHQPKQHLTTQIGNGANISAITKLPVICDFRSVDMALNGQGAPLVPVGDKILFSAYDYCLNLGGIANISYKKNTTQMAFDVCAANIVLNKLANQLNLDFDDKGEIAASANMDVKLLEQLNDLAYYKTSFPKSLGIEWIEKNIFPILNKNTSLTEDKLCTFVAHIAIQISQAIKFSDKKILITGGGAYNAYLIKQIKNYTPNEIVIPPKEIIEFKEALIFGFLGVLRWRNEVNCLQSVTGGEQNNIGGCIYQAFQ